jgi:D-3-phosphoglycerate dehydrogenase
MLKALYFEVLSYTSENLARLRDSFDVVTRDDPRFCTPDMLLDVDVVFAPLGFAFDHAFICACPRLKVIATNTTGTPHIDLVAARRQGITVVSLKDETEFLFTITPTAELTIGLIIAITRNLVPASLATRLGQWRRWDWGGLAMLSKMSLGIVGLGRLGSMVARTASSMGMAIGYYDPSQYSADQKSPHYRRFSSLATLSAVSDVISVHAPLNEDNRHMFDADAFAQFRWGAYFVNTARGELVDSDALVAALECGQVAGAALDVLDGEFDPSFADRIENHPLVRYAQNHSNLILTPHIGGSTRDAWAATQRFTIERAIEAAYGSNVGRNGEHSGSEGG